MRFSLFSSSKRRLRGLLFVALCAAWPVSAAADALALASNYLNQITTAEGAFTQYNPDGTISTGDFALRRPGKMRMDYHGKKSPLLIVGAGRVAIFDRTWSHNRPEQYPLHRTPLGPLLARNVDLSRSDMVIGEMATDERIVVMARDPKHPEYGVAQFGFERDPMRLASWTMTNELGETTHIEFGPLETGHKLPLLMFSVEHQMEKGGRGR